MAQFFGMKQVEASISSANQSTFWWWDKEKCKTRISELQKEMLRRFVK